MAEDTLKDVPKATDFSVILDEVVVTATNGTKKNPKTLLPKHRPPACEKNVFNASENIDAIVRSVPGRLLSRINHSGLVSLNVRGDSGFGRANSMVDGVTQTFTAPQPMLGVGWHLTVWCGD